MTKKGIAIILTFCALVLIMGIIVSQVVITRMNEVLSQFKFIVYPRPQLTNKTLQFTINFAALPEQGASFNYLVVGNYRSEAAFYNHTFYTGDAITIIVQHDGNMKTIPEDALLWCGAIGFVISL